MRDWCMFVVWQTTWVRKPDVPLKAQTMLLKLLGEHFEEIMGWSPHTTGKRSRRGSSSSSHTSSLSTPPSSLRSSWSWCPGPSQRYASMSDTSSSSMDSCNHSTRSSISSVYISEPSLRCSPSPRYGRKFGPGSKTVSSFEASVRSTPKSSIDSSRRPSHIYGLLSSIGSIPRPSLRSSPTPGCGRKYKPRISTTSRSRTKLISNSMNNISSSSTTRKRYYLRSSTQSSSTSSFEDNHGYGHRYGPRASSNHTSTASIRSISSSTESDSYPDTP